ncbi:uracil-DNA glycosylase family protein [Suttonella ornithocola]|uniref:G:T/U mismatch-specific DNA glycosylase n=1 Tax=Suttonella ornithocola TaxID=279832 RepID=A0A380MVW2_9GAMM|nr:uracil-DNA glycosylase family protein [Suttonella ornithocola]SUO95851.1 G:T/U mismatch-specific DNA glycosylase [Suttonella ornithocola]
MKIEDHPLEPFLPKNAKVFMLGSFPPPRIRWKMNFYYPNLQNDMWRIFGIVFFQDPFYFLSEDRKSFKEMAIRTFLAEKGIAIFDVAQQVRRLQGNASDKFLEIVTVSDIKGLLNRLPFCQAVVTTGEKATDALLSVFSEKVSKPTIGHPSRIYWQQRELAFYRLPSSSRAYPLPLVEKAKIYQSFFFDYF